VVLWGSGTPRREFLYSDDLAAAIIQLLNQNAPPNLVNIGAGEDIPIRELAKLIAGVIGYQGEIVQDLNKPDGTPSKLMDSSIIRSLNWEPETTLSEGLKAEYENFQSQMNSGRIRTH